MGVADALLVDEVTVVVVPAVVEVAVVVEFVGASLYI